MTLAPERGEYLIQVGALNVGPTITRGFGAPTSVEPIGSLYLRKDGGANTSLYVNEDGTGSGWAAK